MNIALAADHGGFETKQALIRYFEAENVPVIDLGTHDTTSVDYPDYADKMAECILNKQADLGILICGTGIGISIAANRHKGIRAALIYDDYTAEMAHRHNNANVLVFGGRTMKTDDIVRRIDLFLQASFEGGRHLNRLHKLDK